ncbi:unnamed protein product [Lepidochelys kempii]
MPLRNSTSKAIAKELLQVFARVGIPKEILTDQGTPFMSKLMKDLCTLLCIHAIRTSVYYPHTDGLVEQFNHILKSMIRKVVAQDGKDWDTLLPYLMFAIREVPQVSTSFSPFELLYGCHPCGILAIAKEDWEEQPNPGKNVTEHVTQMRERIARVTPTVREHLEKAGQSRVGYYQRFIPHFATRAGPLTDLIKAQGPKIVKWSDAAEGAFADLRTALCCHPVLIAPDFKKESVLQTDASEVGLGAILSQMVWEEEHPILYLSRKLLPREQKYAVVEKECLAIKWAIETLRYYLLGRRFTLVTDHAPLQWMHRNKTNARVTRWFLSLQPFHFRVQHRAGSQHSNTDSLS